MVGPSRLSQGDKWSIIVSSGVSLAATVGVRHEAVPRSSRMRLSVSMEAKHTLPPIRLSMTAYLGHATMGP